jgi:hypothetical protein
MGWWIRKTSSYDNDKEGGIFTVKMRCFTEDGVVDLSVVEGKLFIDNKFHLRYNSP